MQLTVSGMTCEHCVRAVTQAVTMVPGASGVCVDLDSGVVRLGGTADPDDVRAAIEAEGYEVAAIAA